LSTKIPLLLDECVPAALAKAIEVAPGISSFEAITANHPLGNIGTPDQDLVKYATDRGRILITVGKRLNEKLYKICTHSGIIVISATKRHETEQAKLFARFMRSGHRGGSGHAVTKLRLEGSERLEMGPDETVRTVRLSL
jgi:predicted nuclease of predicted toxin-antitoxin system